MIFQHLKTVIAAVALVAACPSVAQDSRKLLSIAQEFSKAADKCFEDVQNQNRPYRRSVHCKKFGAIHLQWLRAGGEFDYTDGKAPFHAYVMEKAKGTAWQAALRSNLFYKDDPVQLLW